MPPDITMSVTTQKRAISRHDVEHCPVRQNDGSASKIGPKMCDQEALDRVLTGRLVLLLRAPSINAVHNLIGQLDRELLSGGLYLAGRDGFGHCHSESSFQLLAGPT